ncbi:MAG: D-alanyl-D-alanine carboxypeptidase [Novosphingobium sp.]|nr:D-alanyl-D-alanine carboxypeptidase [Novosphingobium sp.]
MVLAVPIVASAPLPPPEASGTPVALLVDLGSGQVLYAREPDKRFLPASMTKVMTAYVAFEEMRRGSLRRDRQIEVRPETAAEWNGKGTSMYLEAGEQVSVDNLLHGIMTASANDASMVLAQGYAGSVKGWTFLMNDSARKLRMTNSHFGTPNGWPDGGHTYVSASDLVRLASAMIRTFPAEYARYSGHKSFKWHDRMLYSHDPATGVVEGADGIKTGFTREAGYNFLGSAQRNGRRLVMVVGGARSEAQRAEASRALLEWGFAEWSARPLFAKGRKIASARIQGGERNAVGLVSPYPVYATAPRGENPQVRLRVVYKGPVPAPIAKGQTIAELEIRVGDLPAGRVPLMAATAVPRGGAMDRLFNGFMNLFS